MLQVNFIRQNPDFVKERLAARNYANIEIVDTILAIDDQLRKVKTASEGIQATMNGIAKEIGILMSKGEKDAAESKKQEVVQLKNDMAEQAALLDQLEADFNKHILLLPNLPHSSVPKGKSAEDNQVIREGGKIPSLSSNAQPHWDLIKQYNLIDFEVGAKLAGSGFPLYKGKGAKLQRSLIQFF